MATYVILANWTEQGVADSQNTLSRANAGATLLKKMGGKLKSILWTMGAYDLVLTIEAPDDETVTAFCLAACLQGNVRTTTLRAFDKAEMQGIIDRLPG